MVYSNYKYLAHHGILGQQWGKRNGPPYPLSPGDHSAHEKKAGYKKSIDSYSDKKDTKGKFQLTDNQKKALKVGAAVAGTLLLAYGGYRLAKNDNFKTIGMKAVDQLSGSSDIKMFGYEGQDALEKVVVQNAKASRSKHKKEGIDGDCTNICSQMAAQVNGRFDVEAGDATWNSMSKMASYFSKDGKKFDFDDKKHYIERKTTFINSSDKLKAELINNFGEDNQWGFIQVPVLKSDRKSTEQHTMFWTITDGVVNVSDGIYGTRAIRYFDQLLRSGDDILISKFDDYDMDIDKMITDGILKKI